MSRSAFTQVQTRAPGRVNIIGEHTDYNDGFVMPCAIAPDTRVHATVRSDRTVAARSSSAQTAHFDLENLPHKRRGEWSDYIAGVLIELCKAGVHLSGAELEITGEVPMGAGLSSSASLEVAVALAMLAASSASIQPTELALLAQRAESNFVGARVGIMDQFAVLYGRRGSAIFLDTRSLEFERIAIPPEAAIVICNTMVKHVLAGGEYNERRAQCEEGVRVLQQRHSNVRALRDVSMEMLESASSELPSVVFARCRHVISENERVKEAAVALRRSDLDRLGSLMYASHESLRLDYEVSCHELDTMVDIAKQFEGTIGARMTGGGFGGCTVNVVHTSRAAAFRQHMRQAYRDAMGITPEIYDGTPSDGACVIDE
jgi:galactokinase